MLAFPGRLTLAPAPVVIDLLETEESRFDTPSLRADAPAAKRRRTSGPRQVGDSESGRQAAEKEAPDCAEVAPERAFAALLSSSSAFVPAEAAPHFVRELLGPALSASARFAALTADGRSWLWLARGLLPPGPERFEALWQRHPPELGKGQLFGKPVTFHRYQQAFGADYAFAGQLAKAAPLTDASAAEVFFVKERLRAWLDESGPGLRAHKYSACLVNWYDGGAQSIGAHSDHERGLVPGAPIFALSWGASRRFVLTPRKADDGRKLEVEVRDGDLIVMGGHCQRTHKHAVPPAAKCKGRRISLTFRCFHSQQ